MLETNKNDWLNDKLAEKGLLVSSHITFNKYLKNTLDTGILSDQKNIVDIMKSSNLFNINRESTYNRRSSTIKGWIDWVLSLINK